MFTIEIQYPQARRASGGEIIRIQLIFANRDREGGTTFPFFINFNRLEPPEKFLEFTGRFLYNAFNQDDS